MYLERLLLLVGLVCTFYCATLGLEARAAKSDSKTFRATAEAATSVPLNERVDDPVALIFFRGDAQVIGRLDIAALKISVPIMSDYESQSLRDGIGHIPGTANAGGLGTMGLAGHRDTYFRALKDIQLGMEIRITTKAGSYHYLVDSTEIVLPEAVRVLDIQSQPELTLITCYPFYYVGAAPQRFIVHAHLVSALPD